MESMVKVNPLFNLSDSIPASTVALIKTLKGKSRIVL
jgi:hypothetical protein